MSDRYYAPGDETDHAPSVLGDRLAQTYAKEGGLNG